jgi:hypothetical protein
MVKNLLLMFFIPFVLFTFSSCGNLKAGSKWKDKEIKIDGNSDEWKDNLTKYDKISVGSYNDDKYLYLCITSNNEETIRQLSGMSGQSIDLWFDPVDKGNKVLGLKFSSSMPSKNMDNQRPPERPDNNINLSVFEDKKPAKPEEPQIEQKIEIYNVNRKVGYIDDVKGIEGIIKFNPEKMFVVCEVKVPLKANKEERFAINPIPGKKVGISLETTQSAMKKSENGQMPQGNGSGSQGGGPGGMPPGGGQGGGPGGQPPGGGGPGGQGGQGSGSGNMSESTLDIYISLLLAEKK